MNTIREQIIARLDHLNEAQAAKVLEFIETIEEPAGEEEYDEANDPLIGFFSGPPDLGERAEEILEEEFGLIKPQDAKDK
jgi:hypothetical protein